VTPTGIPVELSHPQHLAWDASVTGAERILVGDSSERSVSERADLINAGGVVGGKIGSLMWMFMVVFLFFWTLVCYEVNVALASDLSEVKLWTGELAGDLLLDHFILVLQEY
jgi:hypothetical protein